MTEEVKILSEGTPNPNALKFILDKTIMESGSANFSSAEKAESSPLAKRLFALGEVEEVFFGKTFITITKKESSLWEAIYNKVVDEITNHFNSGDPIIIGDGSKSEEQIKSGDPVIDKINEILDKQIRPAIAGDGGDVIFQSFEDGVLRLQLQGACSSCPSSTMTLKHGIEQMLKREVPELKEVISI